MRISYERTVRIDYDGNPVQAKMNLLNNQLYGFSMDIAKHVRSAVPSTAILRFHDRYISQFLKDDGSSSLFDPHSCSKDGLTDPPRWYSLFITFFRPLQIDYPSSICIANKSRRTN